MRPRLLDLYCGAGGAAAGYMKAGFDVVGVDSRPQPRFPGDFVQADALDFLGWHGSEFDAVHASPPCQRFTNAQRIRGREHPEMIEPTRKALEALGAPWVIENVPGAPLCDPVVLCGAMFGLGTYRHRLFECSFPVVQPKEPEHLWTTVKMGRPIPKTGGPYMMHVVGNFSDVEAARYAMGIHWMTRNELREAVPPKYTAYIGLYMRAAL